MDETPDSSADRPVIRGARSAHSARVKGRPLNDQAIAEIRDLFTGETLARDLLIEYLHRIQDRFGGLFSRHLQALAHLMKLAPVEVFEVATFYAHFRVREDGDQPPPVTVRVCGGLPCAMAGAESLHQALAATATSDGPFEIVHAPCVGQCDRAPAVMVGQRLLAPASAEQVAPLVAAGELAPQAPAYTDLAAYRTARGYDLLLACRDGRHTPEEIIDMLDRAGLRGLGGAGFPTGRKWRLLREQPKPRLVALNADEGEPGTFKDRHLLETDPHRVLEGLLIAAWVAEAQDVYLYLRDEYPHIRTILHNEITALEASGLLDGVRLHLRRGAGAYICGEESAMLESLEGKRGLPRHKPPFPVAVGLFGRPTLINNVETIYWLREIAENGPEAFLANGENGGKGMRAYSVSGRVRAPGVKIAPAGITVRRLIDEYCGGMAAGHVFKAYLPGGASGGILPASMADAPLDFGQLEAHGCFIGSAAVIILSEQDDVPAASLNLMRFFEDESCGQCTPCRIGTEKASQLMSEKTWDAPLLQALGSAMSDASICGLGQAAPNTFRSVLKFFANDVR